MSKKRTITIKVAPAKQRFGATEWGGRGKTAHDSRPKRLRTRAANRRAAIADGTS